LNYKPSNTSDKFNVAIRPERIKIIESSEKQFNTVEVAIKEVIYLGKSLKYKVSTDTQDEFTVSLTNELGMKRYKRGDRVLIGWHFEDINVV